MIIFTPIKDIPPEYLESKGIKNVTKYNLSSYINAPSLSVLLPSPEFIPESVLTGDCDNAEFDMAYHKYILDNDVAFSAFMAIITEVAQFPDSLVQILINDSPYRNAITESLSKLIQQRYGYNTYLINEPEDFLYAEEPTFSIPGLFTLDQDLQRWQMAMPPEMQGDLYE